MSDDQVYHDLHNMAAWTIAPVANKEVLHAMSTQTAESLVHALFGLPSEKTDDAVLITLPKKSVENIPREKPLPSQIAKTRWEKFAQEKGIRQRKRSRLVYDETIKDWAPRHGYKSIKQNEDKMEWALEAKPGDADKDDPFEKRRLQKTLVTQKQKYRELRNKMEAAGQKLPTGVSGGDSNIPMKKSKAEVKEQLRRGQSSTASHGRHDSLAKNEVKAHKKKSNKVAPMNRKNEQASHMKMLGKVLGGGGGPDINQAKAARAGIHESETRASKRPRTK